MTCDYCTADNEDVASLYQPCQLCAGSITVCAECHEMIQGYLESSLCPDCLTSYVSRRIAQWEEMPWTTPSAKGRARCHLAMTLLANERLDQIFRGK